MSLYNYAAALEVQNDKRRRDTARGRKVCKCVYQTYNKEQDRFELRFYHVGQQKPFPFADILPDRIIVRGAEYASGLTRLFGVKVWKDSTTKYRGQRTIWFKDNSRPPAHSTLPFTITNDKAIITNPNPAVRKCDSEKRKELVALVQKVRKELRLRSKLGALDLRTVAAPVKTSEYLSIRNKSNLQLLRSCDPEDIQSYRILLVAIRMQLTVFWNSYPPDDVGPYSRVQVTLFKQKSPMSWKAYLKPHAGFPNTNRFGYVPIELVLMFIGAHGGIDYQRSFKGASWMMATDL